MRWLSILRELMRKNDGSMGRLVSVLIRQYPDNQQLLAVCAPWIASKPARSMEEGGDPSISTVAEQSPIVPKGAVLVKKFEKEPLPVPVVAPPDFTDEAPLLVARVDTLWEAMVDTERRMVDLEQWKATLFAGLPPADLAAWRALIDKVSAEHNLPKP